MLEQINDLPTGVIGVRASDKLNQDDYEHVMKPLLEEVHRHGQKINLLYHFSPTFDGFTVGAVWQDFRLGMRHVRLFGKCAIVSQSDWIRKSSEFVGSILPCPVKVFEEEGYRQAIDWLSTPGEEQIEHQLRYDDNVLVVKPRGALSKEAFDTLALTVDPWIEQHGALNGLVIHVKKFPGWENLGSMFRHIQFVRDHHRKVQRVALVADGAIPRFTPEVADHFVEAEVQHFDYDDIEEALRWASCKDRDSNVRGSMQMSDYQEVVRGRIVDRKLGTPIEGARVEVYDKDLMLDDYLGTATTDLDGRFEVDFKLGDYRDSPFEGRPDIFLEVVNPTTGKTTKSKVFEDLSGTLADDDSVEVMDLGDTPVD